MAGSGPGPGCGVMVGAGKRQVSGIWKIAVGLGALVAVGCGGAAAGGGEPPARQHAVAKKQFWEVIDEGPPLVIAILGKLLGRSLPSIPIRQGGVVPTFT